MLRQRLIFGTLLAVAVIAGLIADIALARQMGDLPNWSVAGLNLAPFVFNGMFVTLIVWTFTILAVWEMTELARHGGYRPLRFETSFFASGLAVGPWISMNLPAEYVAHNQSWGMFWLALLVGFSFLAQGMRRGTQSVMVNLSTSLFIVFYCGGLAGYMTKLRMEMGGAEATILLLFSIFLVKMNDVGAFFTGLAFGRNKMIPWLSPKKTWEGMIGGVATTVALAIGIGLWLETTGLAPRHGHVLSSWTFLAAFGATMAFFSIAGDLCESLIKRDLDVKDSSRLIPGLGGVLDVLDSPLLAAPAAWFFWTQVARSAAN
ncbi:MAG: phosphatidate cytidylyltransferase [Phycisphaerae bacterium]